MQVIQATFLVISFRFHRTQREKKKHVNQTSNIVFNWAVFPAPFFPHGNGKSYIIYAGKT
jgi:hypothetical protein